MGITDRDRRQRMAFLDTEHCGPALRRPLLMSLVIPPVAAALTVQLIDGDHLSVTMAVWSVAIAALVVAVVGAVLVARSTRVLDERTRDADQQRRELFDSIPDGIYETAPDGRLIVANEPLAALLGFDSAESLLASAVDTSELWVDRTSRARLTKRALAEGGFRSEVELRRRDGGVITAEVSVSATRAGEEGRHGFRGTVRDVTAAVEARRRLADARERYRLAFENGPIGRAVLSLESDPPHILEVNQPLEELLGYTADELRALDPQVLLHHGDVAAEQAAVERCLLGQTRSFSFGSRRRHRDGTWIPVWLTGSVAHGHDGTSSYALVTVEDQRPRLAAAAEAERAWAESLRRIATAVEYRDEETGAHIERMAAYCEVIGRHLGFEPERARLLRAAAQLHDAGKVAIPDQILLKRGRLTEAERQIVQSHTDVGYQLLHGTGNDVLELAATIAWTHHERFAGGGYPRGIRGEEIPLEGRIAAVADVFDALTTDRLYRPAMPLEDALAILRDGRGRHFDPVVLDVFLAHVDEFVAISHRFRDLVADDTRPVDIAHAPYRRQIRTAEG